MFIAKLNEVLASKKSFIQDPQNFVSLGIALLINIIHWVVLLFKIQPSDERILLHYNVVYGSDIVDKSYYIYFIPSLALFFLVLNSLVSSTMYKREKLASHFLNIASIAVQVIFITASIVLIIANDR